jgi:hypothetical protein
MFSVSELRLLSFLLRISCETSAFPLNWDSRTKSLSPPSSKWKRVITSIYAAGNLIYIVFVVVRFQLEVNGITDPEGRNFSYRIFHVLFLLIHIIMFGIHTGALMHASELVHFVNHLLFFNTESGIF